MVGIRLVSKSLAQCRANQSGEQSFAWFHSRHIYKSRLLPLVVRCYPYIAYLRSSDRLLARPGERSERDRLQAVRLSRKPERDLDSVGIAWGSSMSVEACSCDRPHLSCMIWR